MEISAYVYVEGGEGKDYCFKCAVKQIVSGSLETFDLVLEEGATDSSSDMRSTPKCAVCGRSFYDYYIA